MQSYLLRFAAAVAFFQRHAPLLNIGDVSCSPLPLAEQLLLVVLPSKSDIFCFNLTESSTSEFRAIIWASVHISEAAVQVCVQLSPDAPMCHAPHGGGEGGGEGGGGEGGGEGGGGDGGGEGGGGEGGGRGIMTCVNPYRLVSVDNCDCIASCESSPSKIVSSARSPRKGRLLHSHAVSPLFHEHLGALSQPA